MALIYHPSLDCFEISSDDLPVTSDSFGDDDWIDDDEDDDEPDTIEDLIDREETDNDGEPNEDELCENQARFGGPGSGRHTSGSGDHGVDGISHQQALANASVGTSKQTEDVLHAMHGALASAGYQRTTGLNYQHANGNTVAVSPAPRQRSGVWEARDKNGDHQQHGYGSLSLKSHLGVA